MRARYLLALVLTACGSPGAPDDASGDVQTELSFVRDVAAPDVPLDASLSADADAAAPDARAEAALDAGPDVPRDPCPTGEGLCSGVCVLLAGDPHNCGACGRVCAGLCFEGICADAGTPPADVPPARDAGPEAGDAAVECGITIGAPGCPLQRCVAVPGEHCDQAVYSTVLVCVGSDPEAGTYGTCVVDHCIYSPSCAGSCPDLRTDLNNCGLCGRACPPDDPDAGVRYQCASGMCQRL